MLFFIFLIGLVIGSFANCFIWRLYKGESLWNRSYCPKCKKIIAWRDNVPLLSYFFLRGRCRYCQKKISWQYPAVELVIGLLFSLSFYLNAAKFVSGPITYYNLFFLFNSGFIFLALRDFFVIFVLVVVFVFDLRWKLIPDKLMFPAIGLVFLSNLFLGFGFLDLLFLGALGFSFFGIQFIVSRGAWIGKGDLRLGFFIGIVLGRLSHLTLALFLAYFIGSIIGIGLILAKKKQLDSQVPLGVFLSVSTLIVMFFGEAIIDWYLKFF